MSGKKKEKETLEQTVPAGEAVPAEEREALAPGPVALPKSRFVQIGAEAEEDGTISIISAWDMPHCGVVMRTKNLTPDGRMIGISEVFIPMAGVRDGKIVRSMM